ncbi:hypothetical protein ACFVUS_10155 [Nocardia sp. NPDC058058]|uniref:hypothetical protein n=1 Tax=Nocardia sp. NPDC058058 TaxID=3346317 RepID=UPI0036D78E8A
MTGKKPGPTEFAREMSALIVGGIAALLTGLTWQAHMWPVAVLFGCVAVACAVLLIPAVLADLLGPFILAWTVISALIRLTPVGRRLFSELDMREQGGGAGRGELDAEAGGIGSGSVRVRVDRGE